jgi:hypothetical protein
MSQENLDHPNANGNPFKENDYPEVRVLNTTSMQWLDLKCAPSTVQAALVLINNSKKDKRTDPSVDQS